MVVTVKSGTSRYLLQFYSSEPISGKTCYYYRSNAKIPVECFFVETSPGTYVKNGFCQVDAEKIPGIYQFGVPNEAFIAGACSVAFYFNAERPVIVFVAIEQEKVGLVDVNVTKIAGSNVAVPGTPGGLLALDIDGNLTVDQLIIKDGVSIAKPEQGNAVDILTENGHAINIVAKGEGKQAISLWPKNV